MQQRHPILYSFRRCPYAMRARLALHISKQQCIIREVVLRDKPKQLAAISPKSTVPVLQLMDGRVLEESLEIMFWALDCNDPEKWLKPKKGNLLEMKKLIKINDGPFKKNLDRYKYFNRYETNFPPHFYRDEGANFLYLLNDLLKQQTNLFGNRPALADYAIFPFIRQFADTDRDWFDSQPLHNLQNWLAEKLKTELFSNIMKKHKPWETGSEIIDWLIKN